jgi:hypothetical protein
MDGWMAGAVWCFFLACGASQKLSKSVEVEGYVPSPVPSQSDVLGEPKARPCDKTGPKP